MAIVATDAMSRRFSRDPVANVLPDLIDCGGKILSQVHSYRIDFVTLLSLVVVISWAQFSSTFTLGGDLNGG